MKKRVAFLGLFSFMVMSSTQAAAFDSVLVSGSGVGDRSALALPGTDYSNPNILVSSVMDKTSTDGFIVRQQRRRVKGALVAGPSARDQGILSMFRLSGIKDLEDYAQWVSKNISYKRDRGADIWSSPKETLQNRYGDCEDIAFLNEAALRVMGYEPRVLALGRLRVVMGRLIGSHAICVFKKDGIYYWFDNTSLKKMRTASMDEFTRHLFERYGCTSLLDVDAQAGDWSVLMKRSDKTAQFAL